jgi:hypothetical protein
LKSIFSLFLLCISLAGHAQFMGWDLRPKGLRLGVDAIPAIGSALQPGKQAFGVDADLQFNKLLLAVDYGVSQLESDGPNYRYSNEGSYYRFGLDYNITHRNPFGDAVFAGLRFASASFDEQLVNAYQVPTFGVIQDSTGSEGVNANWIEAVMGLKARIKNNFFLGFTLRYRLAAGLSANSARLETFDIPGYGRNAGGGFGISYHIMYRIPFRKPTPPSIEGLSEGVIDEEEEP